MFRNLAMVIVLLFLQACSKDGPVFHATENPLRLSEWKLLTVADNRIAPAAETLVFKPLNTLFTDYAHKLRTMWIPAGAEVELVNGRFEYPVGTVLSKTFYYPLHASDDLLLSQDSGERIELEADQHRLLETRLLVRREAGWEAFPYVWNDEQTEAFLRVAGASLPVSLRGESGTQHFTYFVPNENQCSGCHTRVHPDGGWSRWVLWLTSSIILWGQRSRAQTASRKGVLFWPRCGSEAGCEPVLCQNPFRPGEMSRCHWLSGPRHIWI
ncbi:MAG: hypothetical protein R3F50_13500 [Gammaproteobacteria bacterium]